MGRPREGQSYECYKSTRTQYKNACRLASNAALGKAGAKTSQLLRCNRHRQFWNVINSATSYDKQRKCKVTLYSLDHFYEDKFKMNSTTTEIIQDNETMVSDKFEGYVIYILRQRWYQRWRSKLGESCWSRRTDYGTVRIRNRKLSASTHQFYVDSVFTTRICP